MLKVTVNTSQSGFARRTILVSLAAGLVVLGIFRLGSSHAAAVGSAIKAGVQDYCLDDFKNNPAPGNKVVLWSCNNSLAQDWSVGNDQIKHAGSCLSVLDSRKDPGAPVAISPCSDSPGQIWLKDGKSYFNPNSAMCLTSQSPKTQLVVMPCGLAPAPNQTWSAALFKSGTQNPACQGTEGQLVACYAEREWVAWQSGAVSHAALLNKYTDNTAYEAWCADFVSYVYKEAGHPLSSAYDGWDENNANNIQNYGFTKHDADSGYVPKAGDIAYFDYNGGHVELVVSGGKTPTFVYGNAAAIDPATGNGQMKANTITGKGSEGRLVYYLSPN